jgi:penicillin-binding protein 2
MDDTNKYNNFSRRSFIVGGIKISLIALLCGRLFYLQFLKYSNYKIMSEKNKLRVVIILPVRGKIYDRNKNIIADNVKTYSLAVDKSADDYKNTIIKITNLLNLDIHNEQLQQKIKNKHSREIVIEEDLDWGQLSKIEENLINLDGASIKYDYSRIYPTDYNTAHIIGYIGKNSDNNRLSQHDNDLKIGKFGVEKQFNQILRGRSGVKKNEVDAYGNVTKEISIEDSVRGESIDLSIDINLQKIAYNLLDQDNGSATLMNIHTGEIEALVSTPSFNNNILSKKINDQDWKIIINDPSSPLINKVISNYYAPGSAFKVVLYLAALEYGFNQNTIITCNGEYKVGNRVFHCSNRYGHGPINLEVAIQKSCNCYAYEVSKIIGIEKIHAISDKLGFGKKTNIELPGELSGTMPNKLWALKNGKIWQIGDTLNTGIGQGYIQATPIQLITAMSRILSNKNISPTIIKQIIKPEYNDLGLSDANISILKNSLNLVVNKQGGTAFNSKLPNAKINIAGKTSTVQVISKRFKHEDLSSAKTNKQFRNHGVFLGYGPVINPQYAVCVYVENVGFTKKAVKIAHNLIQEACIR